MKNKKLLGIPIFITSLAFLGAFLFEHGYQKADAAYETKQMYRENFDGDEINDNWTTTGDVSLKQYYSSMRFTPNQYGWDNSLNFNQKLEGDFRIVLDLATSNSGGWFAISFGEVYANSSFTTSRGGFVFFDNNYSKILEIREGKLDAVEDYALSPFGFNLNTRRKVEIEVKYINENHSSMQCKIYENNNEIGKFFDEPYVTDNLNGYFGFNSNLKNVELYDLKIYNGNDELAYHDDFSESKVLYLSSGSVDSEWYSNGFSESEVKVGFVNSLFANDINSGIIYNSPLKVPENKELDIAYVLESEIQLTPMDFEILSGIEVGKSNKDSRGYFFGLERLSIGYYSLTIIDPDNNIVETLTTYEENATLSVNLKVLIYLNGDISVETNELYYMVHTNSYEGYVGLMTYSKTKEHGKGAYFKSFNLYKKDYYKRDGEDIFINFNGIKKTYFEDIDEYAYDYYLSRQEYDIGTNVGMSKWVKKDNGNGRLEFNNSTGTSYFGPKGIYKDYIVKFEVQINNEEVPYGGCIGLEFGNSRNGLNYQNTKSLGIGYYPDSGGHYSTVPFSTNVDYAPGAKTSFLNPDGTNADIFKGQNHFTMMYIVRDDVVSLHYLLDDENELSLSKERTSVVCRDNETTDGHLAIYGANGISFSIDNLSIINLDYDAPAKEYAGESDYQEVTRIDFSRGETTNGLELDNASINKNKLRIKEDGTLSTSKLVNDGILRFKISDIENELEIKQEELTIRLINDRKPSFIISDMALEQKFELGDNFQYRNSTFEFEKLNNRLIVRFVSGNDAMSVIDNNVYEFNINVSNESDKIVMKAIDGFVDIETFTFLNLNKHASIKNRDYDPDKDYFDPWPEKDSIQDGTGNKGCKGSSETSSIILIFLSLLGLLTFTLSRRQKQ